MCYSKDINKFCPKDAAQIKVGLNFLYLLPGIVGGTETYGVGLLRALAKVSNPSWYWVFVNKETIASGLFREKGWHVVPCSVPARLRAVRYAWEQVLLPFQTRKHHLNLLHSLGYVQPLKLSCKSVVTIHDLNFYNIKMSPFRRAVLQYFVSRSAMSADHIITVSEFSKKQIVEFLGVPPEKVTVTYNAVKEKLSNAVKLEELEERYNAKQPYIFGLSSPSPHKNIANLVRAFALLKQRKDTRNLKLILSGRLPKGSSDLTKALNDTSNSVRDDIIFTGYVSDAMLTSLYLYAEVFVFPSLYEGFGIPIIEAFSCGAPVVCSKMAAIPEVAGDAALYFDPYNVEEMADAIGTVLSKTTLREELVNKGKARAKLFTWEKVAEQTLAVYQKLLS
jgi:glycosyltransferase involved in cell wall biosynthesis